MGVILSCAGLSSGEVTARIQSLPPGLVVTSPEDRMIDLLYRALRTEYGIIVPTNSIERLRAKLYELRRSDPDLSVLTFKPSPTDPNGELWIIKRSDPDAEGEVGRENSEAHSSSI